MRKDSIEYRHVQKIDSTNVLASRVLASESPLNAVVLSTDTQLNGRGQRGTTWQDESGKNLLMSVLSPPISWPASKVFELNMAISLAIYQSLKQYFHLSLKWPNDLMVGSEKLGGILMEPSIRGAYVQRVIIGLGLNVYQTQWGDGIQATSVSLQVSDPPELDRLKREISERIVDAIHKLQSIGTSVKPAYLEANGAYNHIALYEAGQQQFSAKFVDVDLSGRQILQLKDGSKKSFDLKEVKLIKLL